MKTKRYKKLPGKIFRAGESVTLYESNMKNSELKKINSSKDVYDFMTSQEYYDSLTINSFEVFYAIYLSRSNRIKSIEKISEGGISGTVVDNRKLFAPGFIQMAQSIILVHNHPSGVLRPSEQDKNLTIRLLKQSNILEMKILDHIIITSEGYFSFADEGLMY